MKIVCQFPILSNESPTPLFIFSFNKPNPANQTLVKTEDGKFDQQCPAYCDSKIYSIDGGASPFCQGKTRQESTAKVEGTNTGL